MHVMNTETILKISITDLSDTLNLANKIGQNLEGGESIQLIGDIGAGKTTFTKGLAKGLGCQEEIVSPTFTLSREYPCRDGLSLHHYDFYRLDEPGLMSIELEESLQDKNAVTVVEWADSVKDVLPNNCIRIKISPSSLDGRAIQISADQKLIEKLK